MVFVIAEIGVNWNGNYSLVEEMITHSKNAGCDAVKFQSFNEDIVKNHPEKSLLLKSSVNEVNIDKIDDISKKIGIEWFSTPMYSEVVDVLDPYVKRFKIREADSRVLLKNEKSELIQTIMNKNKEIIISSNINPKNVKIFSNSKVNWLYCVPKYPCKLSEVNFEEQKNFVGYSNHCPQIAAPLTAVVFGASILEVHITSDKTKSFFDNNVSFDYSELNDLVRLVRLIENKKN